MECTIRTAVPGDAGVINNLFVQMLSAVYGRTDEIGYPEGSLERFFSGGEDRILVAEYRGEIVAYLSLEVRRAEESFLYCDDFCVQEGFRGQGIGTDLLHGAEQYAAECELCSLVLHVERQNHFARRFYIHRGFRILQTEGSRLRLVKYLTAESFLQRVARMEHYMDTVRQAVCVGAAWSDETTLEHEMLRELIAYSESGLWLEDFERDEQGLFPKTMKRGVLSEDALYDLLCDTDLEGSAVFYEDL